MARRSNHLSIHQRVRSAIHDTQQPTSPTGFLSLKLPPPPCAVLLVSIFIYIYLSLSISTYLPFSISIYLSIHPYLSLSISIHPFLSLSIPIYLCLSLSFSLSSICLSACLSIYLKKVIMLDFLQKWRVAGPKLSTSARLPLQKKLSVELTASCQCVLCFFHSIHLK